MKKTLAFLFSFFIVNLNVYACGEIKSITVDNATVKQLNETSYLVKLNEAKDQVMLNVTSDYDFVNGYDSRIVSTNKNAIVKVDGYKCGFGIYTYTISFEVASKIIAENTTDTNEENKEDAKEIELNPGLQNIEIEGYSIEFSQNQKKYTIEVANDVNSININTKTSEGYTATISDVSKKLEIGNNSIIIMVSDGKDSITYYEVLVIKSAKKSDNNFLASLQVVGYTLNFDSNITNYSLNIPNNVSLLEINAIPEETNAQTDIVGNENLKNGSIITITVTAEDGSTKDYTITIIKKLDLMDLINEYKIYIAISLLIILLIILVIMSKKKQKTKKIAPAAIDVPVTTAGEIKAPVETITPPETVQEAKIDGEPAKLNIITPTDVETPPPQVDENKSTTEVFKL